MDFHEASGPAHKARGAFKVGLMNSRSIFTSENIHTFHTGKSGTLRQLNLPECKLLVGDTYSIAGGQEVDYVVIKLCHMIAYEKFGIFVTGARVFLSHVHPQD